MRNFYKVLGIASSADDLRIKSAFRRRAKAVHPDLNPGNANAEDRFRELMQAYQVLRDAQARAAYDAHLVRRRCEARHRFMQSAGLMAASFVATAVTGSLVLGLMSAPFRENVQLVVASLSSTEANARISDSGKEWTATVASAPSDGTARSTEFAKGAGPAPAEEPKAGAPPPTGAVRQAEAEPRPTAVPSRKAETGVVHRKVASAAPRKALSSEAPTGTRIPSYTGQEGWPGSITADEPLYGLGASGL